MRIAQIVPLLGSVAPDSFFGLGREVYALTEELVRQGHQVTLFATGDSRTSAELVSVCETGLYNQFWQRWLVFHMLNLEAAFKRADEFDIIHNHLELFAAPLARRHATPVLTTPHEPLRPQAEPLFAEYRELPMVAISRCQQQQPFPWLNWQGVVHRGIPLEQYSFRAEPDTYLAFYGLIAPGSGLPAAVEIARLSGVPLKIASSDPFHFDAAYFEQLKPLLEQPAVEYLDHLDDAGRKQLLGGARALLHPIEWDETFTLALVEALACGTPVIATRRGAAPEIVADGLHGFLFDTPEQAAAAVARLPTLSRAACRAAAEERFAIERMAAAYLEHYQRLAA